jgi:hypothetical protein
MKLKSYCLFVLILVPCLGHAAEDKDYTICSVAGFYEGNNNRFLMELAERIAAKNNLFGDEHCTAALKEGRAVGERFNKPGVERRAMDYEIIRNATHFSNLIYDSILSRVKF